MGPTDFIKTTLLTMLLMHNTFAADALEQLDNARNFLLHNKVEKAVSIWQELSLSGNHEAQYLLARHYEKQATSGSFAKAADYYRQSAMQGNVKAQYGLGCLLERTDSEYFDLAGAKQWFEAAAQQGYRQAKNRLQTWDKRHHIEAQDDVVSRAISAVRRNDIGRLQLIVTTKARANLTDSLRLSLLSQAAQLGHEKTVVYLIKAGADTEAEDAQGNTPVMHAVKAGQVRILKQLIRSGSNVNQVNHAGLSPLLLASRQNKPQIIQLLIDNGADIHFEMNGRNALDIARSAGHEEIVVMLKAKGVKPNQVNVKDSLDLIATDFVDDRKTFNGWPALNIACWRGRKNEVIRLLNKKHSVNVLDDENMNSLQRAVIQSHVDIVEILLNHGADLNHTDNAGNTALNYAAQNGDKAIVTVLLETGVANHKKNKKGDYPLDMAIASGNEDVVQLILNKHKAELKQKQLLSAVKKEYVKISSQILEKANFTSDDHFRALSMSIRLKNIKLTQALIKAGIAPGDLNKDHALLLKSVEADSIDMFRLLQANGVRVEGSNPDELLLLAAANGSIDLVNHLLINGSQINSRDAFKNTPLMLASRNGHSSVALLLLNKGADLRTRNRDGDNAEELAKRAGHDLLARDIDARSSGGLWSAFE